METLNHFSNDQKAYLLYQDRLEATRVASTWQRLLKQEKQKTLEMQAAFVQEKQKVSEMQATVEQKDSEIQKLKTLLGNARKKRVDQSISNLFQINRFTGKPHCKF